MLPRFYPIVDTAVLAKSGFAPVRMAEALAAAGAKILQYRHKCTWTQHEFDEAKTIADFCKGGEVQFVMNDRADYAHLLGAALHIGQDDLPALAARKIMGNVMIGFSTHNATQIRQAEGSPVDYLSLGPIFSTQSKEKADPVVGVNGLKMLRRFTSQPLVAIGGITIQNATDVLAAGADSVAVISSLLPTEQLSQWVQI